MPSMIPGSANENFKIEDLSGIDLSTHSNPYDALITACNNDPHKIQDLYSTHRTTRNAQQKAKLLAADFPGLIIDQVLLKIEKPELEPGYVDTRNCLVFWARPPGHIRALVAGIQEKLCAAAPNLWTMPQERLHMTALEITHSITQEEVGVLVQQMMAKLPEIVNYTFTRRTRLVKPMISYDNSAIALSFLPAADEVLPKGRNASDDEFTYHHLRRDLYNLVEDTGVKLNSRYVVPSSHITIGRFLTQDDHVGKMERWIGVIEEINAWLEKEYWPKDGNIKDGGEWIVGQEKGIECREGTLWYGGGNTVLLGKGF